MAGPIRFLSGAGASSSLRSGGSIQAFLNPRDVARVKKRFAQNMGAPLQRRLQIATLKAADLLRGPIAAASPVKTGTLRRSVKARQERATISGRTTATFNALVGPTAPHAHLIIQGHRIVTPGGRYVGRSTRPNPFVTRAAQPLLGQVVAVVKEAAFV